MLKIKCIGLLINTTLIRINTYKQMSRLLVNIMMTLSVTSQNSNMCRINLYGSFWLPTVCHCLYFSHISNTSADNCWEKQEDRCHVWAESSQSWGHVKLKTSRKILLKCNGQFPALVRTCVEIHLYNTSYIIVVMKESAFVSVFFLSASNFSFSRLYSLIPVYLCFPWSFTVVYHLRSVAAD